MSFVTVNNIKINYLLQGSGPHLLMFAPGAFNSVIGNWTSKEGKNAWKEMDGLVALARHFTVIAYDRREAGLSGGRVQALDWNCYVDEAEGILRALKVEQTYLLGGCMGASLATAFAARHSKLCRGLYLHWPVGGYRWMKRAHSVFDKHVEFVRASGLSGVAQRAKQTGGNFWADPESGPWAAPLAHDAAFAAQYLTHDVETYLDLVRRSRDNLFPDPLPSGATPEQLSQIDVPALIMSGKDDAHTISSAWIMRELMPRSELWDVFPPGQTGENTLEQIIRFKTQLELSN